MEFHKIAPYLSDPLVLIGFFLLLAFAFLRYLVKKGIIVPMPKAHGYKILKLILLYGFIIGILLIISGFVLKHESLVKQQQTVESAISELKDFLINQGVPPGKANEIAEQKRVLLQSGALSSEQFERAIEELRGQIAQSSQNSNHSTEPKSSSTPKSEEKQLASQSAKNSNTQTQPPQEKPATTNPPPVDTPMPQISQPAERTVEIVRENPPKTWNDPFPEKPGAPIIVSPTVVVSDGGSDPLITCRERKDQDFVCMGDAVRILSSYPGKTITIVGYGEKTATEGQSLANRFGRQLVDALIKKGFKVNESRFAAGSGRSDGDVRVEVYVK